jgi:MFS family permease
MDGVMPMQASASRAPAYRWYVLGVVTAIYALNIADRFVVSTLIEPIKHEFMLSDGAVGLLTGAALAVFYVAAGIPLGIVADRTNRARMIWMSLSAWSLFTTLCGLTHTFWQLLIARIAVGIGEAGGTPPAQSLLADYFPWRSRALAMSLYALGAAAGAALGSALGGALNDAFGWRTVLVVFGLLGLPVALVTMLTLREPVRGQTDVDEPNASQAVSGATLRDALAFIAGSRPLLHLLAGTFVLSFAGWGMVWWVPSFLQRSHGLTLRDSGAALGLMHSLGGVAVTLLTAWVMATSRGRSWPSQSRFVAIATLLVTIPALLAFLSHSTQMTMAMLWLFVPSIYLYIGPTLGIAQNLTPAELRGFVCALILFASNVANLVVSPILIGFLSDAIAPRLVHSADSLRVVLAIMSLTGFWASWHYWAAALGAKEEHG